MSEDWPTFFDPKTCVRRGLCPVTKLRAQSETLEGHTIYFEQHGTGAERVVLIIGLNTSSFSWGSQVQRLASKHSVLVFDNRGVGNSSAPVGPYTTVGMAEDVMALLDYIGWTEEIHVVGLSLGGMVAQELALRIPNRIVSLSLCVTKAGGLSWSSWTPWKGVCYLLRSTITTDIKAKIPIVLDMVFPGHWLDSQSPDDPDGRTNRQIQTENYTRRAKVTRPQPLLGALAQMSAATTHCVTPDRLRMISASVPKIIILTGDEDNLVNPENSKELAARIPEAELVIWEGTGHAVHAQWPERFSKLLDRVVMEGREQFEVRKKEASSI